MSAAMLAGAVAWAQMAPAAAFSADWRHIGNSAVQLALPSAATGPVDRVWYSTDGGAFYARTHSGRTFQTTDFDIWKQVVDTAALPPSASNETAPNSPEPGARVRGRGVRLYSFAMNAFRSDDGGETWTNLTEYKNASILGAALSDMAVSPLNPDEVTVSNAAGVWRSVDAGLTWTGLNTALPNLPVRRIFTVPSGTVGLRLGLSIENAPELEWAPGERTAWRVVQGIEAQRESALKQFAGQALNVRITAVSSSGDAIYAGSADGRLWTSLDKGATWSPPWESPGAGPVEAIYVDPKDARTAVAAFGAHSKPLDSRLTPMHVARTMNGGLFWDNVTGNLPDAAAHGVTADRTSGAVYVATGDGVFLAVMDLASAGRPGVWTPAGSGLPDAPAMDVRLDSGGNQLYVAVDGYGVYAAMAPHRFRDARVVNAADYSGRAAAPGSLLSVLGARVDAARAGALIVPVLASDGNGTQIQVPFGASGDNIALSLQASDKTIAAGFPLREVSPAIFVDPDGTPMILDGDSGEMLDASKPAHSGTRIQILATGLGRVDPEWPTGTPAPAANPPRVIAPLRAYLDQRQLEIGRAVLAPYVGYYLIEIELPRIVDAGPAELYIEAAGQPSNRVRLYIEP